jgi:hypothetical protein
MRRRISDAVTDSEIRTAEQGETDICGLFKTLNEERSDVIGGSSGMLANKRNFPIRSAVLQLHGFRIGLIPIRAESTN